MIDREKSIEELVEDSPECGLIKGSPTGEVTVMVFVAMMMIVVTVCFFV